jgi:hypothetical protein
MRRGLSRGSFTVAVGVETTALRKSNDRGGSTIAMTTTAETTGHNGFTEPSDQLIERFTRVFGRPPSQSDLARFRRARTGLELRMPAQVRRAAATLVARL